MLGTMATIAREEGVASLWKGIVPGLHRHCLFGDLRIGLYEPVKNVYVGKDHVGDAPLLKKIAAGLTTGALAICVASPTDLVKVPIPVGGQARAGRAASVQRRHECIFHHRQAGRFYETVDVAWSECGSERHHQRCRTG